MLSSRVILRYAGIHLTELALVVTAVIVLAHFVPIPTWAIITFLVLWVLKDIAIFPKVWRAYAVVENDPIRRLVGLEATVVDGLDPVGYVRVGGELWKAETTDPHRPARRGDRMRVVEVRGVTLTVENAHVSEGSEAGR
jgi:membrane protein implicated in regulation of membrane protease activity